MLWGKSMTTHHGQAEYDERRHFISGHSGRMKNDRVDAYNECVVRSRHISTQRVSPMLGLLEFTACIAW
jgi:ribonuclease HI